MTGQEFSLSLCPSLPLSLPPSPFIFYFSFLCVLVAFFLVRVNIGDLWVSFFIVNKGKLNGSLVCAVALFLACTLSLSLALSRFCSISQRAKKA